MLHLAADPARFARARPAHFAMLAIALPLWLAAPAAGAQQRATIAGVVSAAESGQPVAGARVTVRGRKTPALSDSTGHYRLTEVPPGTLILQVRAIGHADATRIVEVAPGATVSVDVALSGATQLGEVVVTGRQPELPTRFAEYEYRRKNGRGQYLGRTEIEKANAMNVPNLLRNMRGVRLECAGITCMVRMARSTGVDCPPEYWVDGRPSPHFGPTMPVSDLEAVEVYTGPAEAPAEFLSGNAACGIIVLWTKSTP